MRRNVTAVVVVTDARIPRDVHRGVLVHLLKLVDELLVVHGRDAVRIEVVTHT